MKERWQGLSTAATTHTSAVFLGATGTAMWIVAASNMENEVIAGLLAFFGLIAIVLGSIVERIEGPLKISRDTLEAIVRARNVQVAEGKTTPIEDVYKSETAITVPSVDPIVPVPSDYQAQNNADAGFTKVLPNAIVELTTGAKQDLDRYDPAMRKSILSSILNAIVGASNTTFREHEIRGSQTYFTASLGPGMTVAFREGDKIPGDERQRYFVLGIYPAEAGN